MRATLRQEAAITLAITAATLLLAGFGCPLMPAAPDEPGEGISDGVQNPTGPSLDTPGDNGDDGVWEDDANNPFPRGKKPVVWFVGEPVASFAHVQPGVKSELYIDFETGGGDADLYAQDPNTPTPLVTVEMEGPGVMGDKVETKPFQPNTKMHFIFPINRFGDYTANGDIMENGHSVFHFEVPEKVK